MKNVFNQKKKKKNLQPFFCLCHRAQHYRSCDDKLNQNGAEDGLILSEGNSFKLRIYLGITFNIRLSFSEV